jgi:hypothetical protein
VQLSVFWFILAIENFFPDCSGRISFLNIPIHTKSLYVFITVPFSHLITKKGGLDSQLEVIKLIGRGTTIQQQSVINDAGLCRFNVLFSCILVNFLVSW